MTDSPATAGAFRHVGLFYRTADGYATTVTGFLRSRRRRRRAVLRRRPWRRDALRRARAPRRRAARRRPAWISPRVLAFVGLHAVRHVRYVGDSLWAARRPGERHEAASLEPVSVPAVTHPYRTDLSQVRALVLKHAIDAGLPEARASDLVLAVSEVAANTLRHTQSAGTLSIWDRADEIVCEIHDEGIITDPLAGQHRPAPDSLGGHGLWLVHQVCDLVELRSDNTGTTIRMHMALPPRGPLG